VIKEYLLPQEGGNCMGFPYLGLSAYRIRCNAFVLAKTVYGKGIYAIGGNPEAARLSVSL
jgi:ABC-type xylose transport system permease subunit